MRAQCALDVHAGAFGGPRHFRGDRRYFAAVKPEVPQRVVIEVAQQVADGLHLPTLSMACGRAARDRGDGMHRRDDERFQRKAATATRRLQRWKIRLLRSFGTN
jgi:hypothetical protein